MHRKVIAIIASGAAICCTVALGAPNATASPPARKAATPIYLDPHYLPAERAADLVSRLTLAQKASADEQQFGPGHPATGRGRLGLVERGRPRRRPAADQHERQPADPDQHHVLPGRPVARQHVEPGPGARGGRPDLRRGPRRGPEQHPGPGLLLADRQPRAGPALGPQRRDVERGPARSPAPSRRSSSTGCRARTRTAGCPRRRTATSRPSPRSSTSPRTTASTTARTGSSDMDQRTLREYYTAQFRDIIQNSDPGSIMSSYNEVNGVPAAANVQLIDTLARQTFGFGGYFTSDCDAIYEIQAGHHWQPPGAPAPLDQYGRHRLRELRRRGPGLQPGLPRRLQLRRTRSRPRSRTTSRPRPTSTTRATSTSRSSGCSPPASRPASSTRRTRCPGYGARARLAPGTWTNSDANNAVTETPDAAGPGPAASPTRASSC